MRTSSQHFRHSARSRSGSGRPVVVEAVTETTMTVAEGRTDPRSSSVKSVSLPIIRTTLA